MADALPKAPHLPPRFAVPLASRDPERIPGFTLPIRQRAAPANQPQARSCPDTDRLSSLTSQYLSSWFLRAPADVIPLSLEQRHLILLQAQLHASRVVLKEMRARGAGDDAQLALIVRRMQKQIHWLLMGVSALDIAEFSSAHPSGDLPDTPPPISKPSLEFMAAAND